MSTYQLCERCQMLAPVEVLTRAPGQWRFEHTDPALCAAEKARGERTTAESTDTVPSSRRVRKKETSRSPAAQLLLAMTALERKAHRILAQELSVTDAALAQWVVRAMAAAQLLHGYAEAGHGKLVTASRLGAPATLPLLLLHEEHSGSVVDLTAYRLKRQMRAAVGR